jgi:hypothetical protein
MGSKNEILKTVALDDSTWAVVQTDPSQLRFMEVVATFYDEARARDYANWLNGESPKQNEAAAAPEGDFTKPGGTKADLSQRQSAVLKALRDKMDGKNLVAVKAAALAQAAKIPLGSLHSVLVSLEKKQMIQTSRPGSARSPAVYHVL